MASKIRCPGCGAKNEVTSRRCRICTAVINLDAPDPVPEVDPSASPALSALTDHFDAGEINRQVQPARARFGSGGSGLGARIAAANGGPSVEPRAVSSTPSSAPTAAAIAHDDEPFDADALFRDQG
jgi:hypothetical protein